MVVIGPHLRAIGFVSSVGMIFMHSEGLLASGEKYPETDSLISNPLQSRGSKQSSQKSTGSEEDTVKSDQLDLISTPRDLRLQSDRQSYDSARQLFVASGRAKASINGFLLRADRIELDKDFKSLQARGRVRLQKGGQYFQANSLTYNLLKRQGELNQVYGVIDLSNFLEELKNNSSRKSLKNISDPLLAESPVAKGQNTLLSQHQSQIFSPNKELENGIKRNITKVILKDNFIIKASIGGSERSSRVLGISSNLYQSRIGRFISGSITRWRFQANKLVLNKNGWEADRISFSNDPFTPTQTRIEAYGVTLLEEDQGDLLISSRRSRLVLEEKIRIPFITKKRITDEQVESRWLFGIDNKDRDGLYAGLDLKPFELNKKYTLSVQPQILLQRALFGSTNSYASPKDSIYSSNENSLAKTSDLFGLKARLKGDLYGWGTNLNANISSFNRERLAQASRFWTGIDKTYEMPLLREVDVNIFGAYRYRAWNGSLGRTDIYTAYGAFLEKKGSKNMWLSKINYLVRLGAGKYQAEALGNSSMKDLWRGNIYGQINSRIPIYSGEKAKLLEKDLLRYSPAPIVPGLWLDTYLNSSYSVYGNGQNQNTIGMKFGPTLTLGNFTKKFFDYTKLSILAGAKLKQGESPFHFDQAVDLATVAIGLSQQLIGPLVLNTDFELNIDGGSQYFGKAINSKFQLSWQRRSYELALYYNPYKGIGGFGIRLNDFNFNGTGVPFLEQPQVATNDITDLEI